MKLAKYALPIAIGLIAVAAITLLFAYPNVSDNHRSIVDKVKIFDTRNGQSLVPKLVDGKTITLGADLAVFDQGSDYSQSTWVWSRADETEWCMTIIGPDESGVSYIVEFGRISPGSFEIYYDGVYKVGFVESWSTPASGYWWMEVQLIG